MNVKLNVGERIALLGILPGEGNFVTLKIVRDLQNALTFSEKEIAEIELEINDICPSCGGAGQMDKQKCPQCSGTGKIPGQLRWNPKKGGEKEIPCGDMAKRIIKEKLKELDKENKLTLGQVSLYEKFVESSGEGKDEKKPKKAS